MEIILTGFIKFTKTFKVFNTHPFRYGKFEFISVLRKIVPIQVCHFLKTTYYFFTNIYKPAYFIILQSRYKKIVLQIQKKDKIKVAFFLIHEAVWKYEGLYKLMELDKRFDPVVIVCPYVIYGEENMLNDMDQAYSAFQKRGYNVIKTFNKETNEWLDVKKEIQPDIVFFTNPHKLTKDEYFIANFLRTLNCYVPYTFQTTYNYQNNYNAFFHNVLWKAYYPTSIHYDMAVRYAINKGINGVVTGYPGIDRFLKFTSSEKSKKKVNLKKKNIIWAPHHTIEGEGLNLNFSNFLRYSNFMIQLAKDFKNEIFITFKPHPILKCKLYKSEIWGKDKTDAYYQFWKENDFCALNEGNYQSLFEESDAMIHDCDSFMGEYLSLNKPVLYTSRDNHVKDRMNEFGRSANKMHYLASNEKEILKFIREVVINGADTMKDQRTKWIREFITPPNNREASMNIYIDIKKSLKID